MGNWYVNLGTLIDSINLPASATGDHDQLRATIEADSRLIDDWLGYHAYPALEVHNLTTTNSWRLHLTRPLLAVTTLRTDANGDASYESTWATTQYDLAPYNASYESPPLPYWDIEVRASSTNVLPAHVRRGVELTGTRGLFNLRDTSTATLDADLNATAETFGIKGATSLQPGHTIRIGSEDMFVLRSPVTATGAHTSQVTVERGRNGTSGSTHSSATGIEVYRYPIVDRATLYQAQHDFKLTLASPSAGGAGFGPTAPMAEGDLHPAVRRMLRSFRTPAVG